MKDKMKMMMNKGMAFAKAHPIPVLLGVIGLVIVMRILF